MADGLSDPRVCARDDPHWTEVLDAVPGPAFVGDPAGNNLFTNWYFQQFTGKSAEDLLGQGWLNILHEDDRPRAARAWRDAVVAKAAYDEEYRLRQADGEIRWFRCRASPTLDRNGNVVRWVGVAFDVQRRKQAEEHRELVVSELSHRTKNLLTIVQAVSRLTARSIRDPEAFQHTLEGRLAALGRVSDLLSGAHWTAAPLGALLSAEAAPFGVELGKRIMCRGPDVLVPAAVGPSLALVVHELLTNAVKYGALSTAHGAVSIEWRKEGLSTHVEWRESGGPELLTPPGRPGFGSRLIQTVLKRDLGPGAEYMLAREGVRCCFSIPSPRQEGPNDPQFDGRPL